MSLLIQQIKSISLYVYILTLVVASLVVAGGLFLFGATELAISTLKYSLIAGSFLVWYSLLRDLTRGAFGVDIIAGVALIGTYVTEHYLAGVVVLLMLSGGQLFEIYAMARARKELSSLLMRTPLFAHVKDETGIHDIPLEKITPGMTVLIKAGEIVSVDGVVLEGVTTINEATLTGESFPVKKELGANVYAGTENINDVILVRVEKGAHESRYQSIISLVKQAEESKAPIVRLADRYSLYFTGITFIIAFIAWIISYDLTRVVAVLVVATPCPLLLATPIAIISGMSKAAGRGVIVKSGGTLEMLSRIHTFIFDKTGTLTLGTPEVQRGISFGGHTEDEILHLAASLDQLSLHIVARSLVLYAHQKKVDLLYPKEFKEIIGDGVTGNINNSSYAFGKKEFVEKLIGGSSEAAEKVHKEALEGGTNSVFLACDGELIGAVIFEDTLRKEAETLFSKLHKEGVTKTLILTGDKKERADLVAKKLHVDEVISDCLPEDKLHQIEKEQSKGNLVAMVGDGINDAPSLAKADVGIALGTQGETASSDAADIVILSHSITRIHDVLHISKKTVALAKQGIFIGIGASTIAMVLSALGYIPPLLGVLLQEGIDVVVIMNALRLGRILKKNNQ